MFFLLYLGSISISMDNVFLCADSDGTVQVESAWILDDCCRQTGVENDSCNSYDPCTHYQSELKLMPQCRTYFSSVVSPVSPLLMSHVWKRSISKNIFTFCNGIYVSSNNSHTIIFLI
jgi:hypothetical protein